MHRPLYEADYGVSIAEQIKVHAIDAKELKKTFETDIDDWSKIFSNKITRFNHFPEIDGYVEDMLLAKSHEKLKMFFKTAHIAGYFSFPDSRIYNSAAAYVIAHSETEEEALSLIKYFIQVGINICWSERGLSTFSKLEEELLIDSLDLKLRCEFPKLTHKILMEVAEYPDKLIRTEGSLETYLRVLMASGDFELVLETIFFAYQRKQILKNENTPFKLLHSSKQIKAYRMNFSSYLMVAAALSEEQHFDFLERLFEIAFYQNDKCILDAYIYVIGRLVSVKNKRELSRFLKYWKRVVEMWNNDTIALMVRRSTETYYVRSILEVIFECGKRGITFDIDIIDKLYDPAFSRLASDVAEELLEYHLKNKVYRPESEDLEFAEEINRSTPEEDEKFEKLLDLFSDDELDTSLFPDDMGEEEYEESEYSSYDDYTEDEDSENESEESD
jgi:hypothetical protein